MFDQLLLRMYKKSHVAVKIVESRNIRSVIIDMNSRDKLGTLPKADASVTTDGYKEERQSAVFDRYGPTGTIHQNLQKYRKSMRLKKKEMAEIMEITPRTYYAYETGARPIPTPCVVRLAILTGGDLNEMLLGRPATPKSETIESAISDFVAVMCFLDLEYEDMDTKIKADIARLVVSTDWHGLPRMHPEMIRDAVRLVTKYRFHPENLPAPPLD